MLQWFLRFTEFAEFTEFKENSALFRENTIIHLKPHEITSGVLKW